MELFKYQQDAINKIKQAFRNGKKAPILRLDCGAGKTVIAADITKNALIKDSRVLFLVHRIELKEQTEDEFKDYGVNIENENLKIEMVITAGNKLKEFNADLILADECNFALAKSWLKVFNQNPNAKIIGLSATPERLSGEPMGEVFDDIIEVITAEELIKIGRLAPYDYYAPKLDFELNKIKKRAGDYAAEELEKILSKPKIYGDIIKYFKQLIPNKKTIAYCTTVAHSEQMAAEFKANGINAVHFDGTTPAKERKQIVKDFKEGKIQVLCNCELISFGFNVPDCEAVILARPTQSRALYIQQAMRPLRAKPGKRATILDFVANVHRHGMPTNKQNYSLTGKTKCANPDGEPEVKARQCTNCFKTYEGTARLCPFCSYDNGMTQREIKQLQKAELERIEQMERYKDLSERKNAKDYKDLVELGRKRGYKNPEKWASIIYQSREEKQRARQEKKQEVEKQKDLTREAERLYGHTAIKLRETGEIELRNFIIKNTKYQIKNTTLIVRIFNQKHMDYMMTERNTKILTEILKSVGFEGNIFYYNLQNNTQQNVIINKLRNLFGNLLEIE